MDCRKARYCLVASFDAPLAEADQKNLKYHLKDCRACRHEAFYYRELFAAEKQLEEYSVSDGFNERLISKIRMNEAKAHWPERHTSAGQSEGPRWQRVVAPVLFAAAAVFSFVFFMPDDVQKFDAAPEVTAPAMEPVPSVAQATRPRMAAEPRYRYGLINPVGTSSPQSLFRLSPSSLSNRRSSDPFRQLVDSRQFSSSDYRARLRTRYLLPVVTSATVRERIY